MTEAIQSALSVEVLLVIGVLGLLVAVFFPTSRARGRRGANRRTHGGLARFTVVWTVAVVVMLVGRLASHLIVESLRHMVHAAS